jgi:hypothetical protein
MNTALRAIMGPTGFPVRWYTVSFPVVKPARNYGVDLHYKTTTEAETMSEEPCWNISKIIG